MSFNYQVNVTDPGNAGGSADTVLASDLDKALDTWGQYISGRGTLNVNLNIVQTSVGREDGGPSAVIQSGTTDSGNAVYEPASLYELQTGKHVPGSTSDITIDVSPSYFSSLDLDPNLNANSQTGSNTYNPITVFLHEIMHGFGQDGYIQNDGTPSGDYKSTFDQFIQKTGSGTAYFTGPNAEAAYGGPVQLTTDGSSESYYHFGDTDSDLYKSPSTVSDPLTLDLMNGIVFFYNYPYQISNLDLGVMQDLGYNVTGGNSGVSYVDNADGSHVITGLADGQQLNAIHNDVMTGGGVNETFSFIPGFGHSEITDFIVGGSGRDSIDLSKTKYTDIGELLKHTSMADGNAVVHLNAQDSITFDGVTKNQLKYHSGDFTFA